jgi:hypothetical protein
VVYTYFFAQETGCSSVLAITFTCVIVV